MRAASFVLKLHREVCWCQEAIPVASVDRYLCFNRVRRVWDFLDKLIVYLAARRSVYENEYAMVGDGSARKLSFLGNCLFSYYV